jgi:thioredoxin-related protein
MVAMPGVAQTKRRPALRAKYIPVTQYDPKRDAAQDIRNAINEAMRTRKHILLEVGGEWCSWCHRLDVFFQANPDLRRLCDKNFVTVKINFSEENENKAVLCFTIPFGFMMLTGLFQ